ncbi:hypothetical protein K7X08_033439 [Anisodus acutangulus]|uniref:Uncharacterized protein n=1 Tax=Anisodus acutangulus TaxID=402998 RepID=A0A9Q1M369_9SOLA|nr:hypothetical protein K7X08_033439 [Anisodus acutangulus]
MYAIPVEPFPCESTWEIPLNVSEEIVLPPERPKMKRIKPFHETTDLNFQKDNCWKQTEAIRRKFDNLAEGEVLTQTE